MELFTGWRRIKARSVGRILTNVVAFKSPALALPPAGLLFPLLSIAHSLLITSLLVLIALLRGG